MLIFDSAFSAATRMHNAVISPATTQARKGPGVEGDDKELLSIREGDRDGPEKQGVNVNVIIY